MVCQGRLWLRWGGLLALLGLARGYFPGMKRNDDLTAFCENAQSYRRGGSAGRAPASGGSPFAVSLSMREYIPGQDIEVSVKGKIPFIGLILQARRPDQSFGSFRLPAGEDKDQLKNCDADSDTLYLWLPSTKTSVTVNWSPPQDDKDQISFIGKVFLPNGTFYNATSPQRISKGFASIDVTECGKSKGCFRYSPDRSACTEDTCTYLVTYRSDDQKAHFELVANDGWGAIGFSSDPYMGGDDVFMCVKQPNGPEILHYRNQVQHHAPEQMKHNPLVNQEAETGEDGRVKCRFSRLLKVGEPQNIDLNNDWFQLYAWGPVYDRHSSSSSIMRHKHKPPVSDSKITLLQHRDVISACHVTTASLALLAHLVALTTLLLT